MKLTTVIFSGLVLLHGSITLAQDYPKVEVPVFYSYMRFNPENSNIVSGFSLNGGGGGVTVNVNHFLGIEAEFAGYQSLTKTFAFPATANSPCPTGCTVTADANLFTYNIGPILKYRTRHFEPFVETMFGGAHSNTYQNLFKACQGACSTTNNPSNNAFDFIIGGGIDIPVSSHIAIRPVQVDYVLTRFGNGFTKGNQNQSNLRYNAGIVFRFGGNPASAPVNHLPVASCSANPVQVNAESGDSVLVRADASDSDNETLNYTWTANAGTVDGTGAQVRWNYAGLEPSTYTVTARVDDGRGGKTTCSADIRVEPRRNRPPTMSCSARPSPVHPGDRVHIAATASDPDSDRLTYTWNTNGGQIAGSGAEVELDTTGLAPARYTVTGRVDDGRGGAADCTAQLSVEAAPPPAVEARLAIRSIYFPTALPSTGKPDVGLVESQQRTLTSLSNDFKEYLTSRPDAHLVLEGHTDRRGAPEYNQSLSERRVEIAKQFLVKQGVPEANLEVKALGEEQNMAPEQVQQLVEQHPNLTEEQRSKILKNLQTITLAQNRRVDITLSSTGQQSVRQFPFNAEDALTLINPKAGAKPMAKKKAQ
ncbi:MAG TPA: OmpA family protein [Candidatus Acidoferrum sp.]|nr:OmpA family protein [Candidatus Acidoferrum sp.]